MKARCDRRRFLGTALAAGLGTLSGCRRDRGRSLRIFVYAGGHERAMRDVFVPEFEKRTGVPVVLDSGWTDAIAKLKSSPRNNPAFDLVITDATQGYPAIREGLFQKLDLTRIPNHKNLAPVVLDNWVFKQGYGITYPDSVMTIAYHKDLLKSPPTGWADLLRDDLRGQVALYNQLYMSLYTFACMKAAQEGKAGTAAAALEKDPEAILHFARANRDRIAFWWPNSTAMIVHLKQKGCALGNMHSPEYLQTLKDLPQLGAVVPDKDRAFVQVMWVIPEGTAQKELAEDAIDLMFSVDLQKGFARYGMATAVLPAAQAAAEENRFWKQIYPSTEAGLTALRYYPYDAYFRDWKHLNEFWDREVLRKG